MESIERVYRRLVSLNEDGTTTDALGMVAFGLFMSELYIWLDNRIKKNAPVTPDEINKHIDLNFPDPYFTQLENRALTAFATASWALLAEDIERAKSQAVEDSIVNTLKAHTATEKADLTELLARINERSHAMEVTIAESGGFKRQFGLAVLTSIIAPVALGVLIASILIFTNYLPTPNQIADLIAARVNTTSNSEPQRTQ